MSRGLLLVAIAATLLAGACASLSSGDTGMPAAGQEFRLGPGDKLHVTVFGQPDMSGDFTVGSAGAVDLPLVGSVVAKGKTASEFQLALKKSLTGTFLANPSVSVEVVEYRPFYILGEVNKPGAYPAVVGLTITQAVATAQGFTYRANTHRVLIRHEGEANEKSYPVAPTTVVEPGDTIRVLQRFF